MPTLIVGLGNPGKKYEDTRHNAGFKAVEIFRKRHAADFPDWRTDKKLRGRQTHGSLGGKKIILLQPQTFMNESGGCLAAAAGFWKVEPDDIIVVYDDLDLPVGKIRVRPGGSAGGHNGLRSIIDRLGTEDLARVRIGIAGERRRSVPAEDYVLKRFEPNESELIGTGLHKAADALESILEVGLEAAMNDANADGPELK